MPKTDIHDSELVPPVESLGRCIRTGGTTVIRAAFEHSYFVHPDRLRGTRHYPDRVRLSRQHCYGLDTDNHAIWQDREVKLGDNAKAQQVLAHYTGRRIERAAGNGVRHVWGHPWDLDSFTAGWNSLYMLLLNCHADCAAGSSTEIGDSGWPGCAEFQFRISSVHAPPNFVTDLGIDFDAFLNS